MQVCLALAMLIMLVGALWPKLACRTSVSDDSFRVRRSRAPLQQATFRSSYRSRHALRVRESYDRMFGRWLNSERSAPEDPPKKRAA
jgi:hypothetical protein